MVHFTCDLCGKDLTTGEPRYVVKIAAYAGFDPTEVGQAGDPGRGVARSTGATIRSSVRGAARCSAL
jgi:hypothetical protein